MTRQDDPYRGLKVGVHSYSLRKFSFTETVRMTKELGVRYLGVNPIHVPLDSAPAELAEKKAHIEEAGLTLLACGVMHFDGDRNKAKHIFDYAKRLGIETVAAHPKPDSFDILDELVAEYGIRVAIHNHGPEGEYQMPDDVLRAVDGHHELIGACVDLGHYERSNVRAEEALRALSSRVYDVHIKDVDRAAKDGRTVVLGEGIVNLSAVFDEILKMKLDCHIALEYESEPDDPFPGMDRSFAYVRRLLADKTA